MRLNQSVSHIQSVRQIRRCAQAGVSLLEFVIGLVLLAIILLGVTLFSVNQARQLDPVFQFRAVSLVEAVVEQVLVVKYDAENNPYQKVRCDISSEEGQLPQASCSNTIVATDNKITEFTVVDDFQWWCDSNAPAGGGAIAGHLLAQQLGLPHPHLYRRLSIVSCVKPIEEASNPPYKRVTIKVNINAGDSLTFSLHRYNIL